MKNQITFSKDQIEASDIEAQRKSGFETELKYGNSGDRHTQYPPDQEQPGVHPTHSEIDMTPEQSGWRTW